MTIWTRARAFFVAACLCSTSSARLQGFVLWSFDGPSGGAQLGFAVAAAGDVDGDGVSDVIVGAPSAGLPSSLSGQAFVLSGADGSIVLLLPGTGGGFGRSVDGGGDVDGDGIPDLVVGAPLAGYPGAHRSGLGAGWRTACPKRACAMRSPPRRLRSVFPGTPAGLCARGAPGHTRGA